MKDIDRARTPSDPLVRWCTTTAIERANSESMPRMGRRDSERSIMTVASVASVAEERESQSTNSDAGADTQYINEVTRVGARQAALNLYSPEIVWVGRTQQHQFTNADVSPGTRPISHRIDTNDILDLYLDDDQTPKAWEGALQAQRVSEIAADDATNTDDVIAERVTHERKDATRSRRSSLAIVAHPPTETDSQPSSVLDAPIQPSIILPNTLPLRRDVSPRDRSAYRASIYQRIFSRQHDEVNNLPLQPLKSALKQPNTESRRRASTRTKFQREPVGCCVIQ